MKKIIFLIFGILFSTSLMGTALAADPTISIPSGWITPPNSATIGTTVTIKFKVENTPANAVKIQMSIRNPAGQFFLKDEWLATEGPLDGTHQYDWDTKAAGSSPGEHMIAIAELDANGYLVGDQELHHTYILTPATTPPNGTPPDDNSGGTPTGGDGVSFNLGDLGTINFDPTKVHSIPEIIAAIINLLLMLVGSLAVLAIVYSGVMYITASGDQTRAETAKKNLTWAIMGIVIVALSFLVVEIVSRTLQ